MTFSIIIPVFNAQDYLTKCLDSVFNQKFECNIEVIVVDDFSEDSSLSILNNYKKKFENLTVIKHPKNIGQTAARVKGMNEAKGDYVMHVDADDWLLPKSIQYVYEKCLEFNPDILIFDYFTDKEGIQNIKYKIKNEHFIKGNKSDVHKYFFGNSASKVVKRELTKSMITGEKKVKTTGDDLLYCTEILLRGKTFLIIPQVFYAIRIHENSLTSRISTELRLRYIYNLLDTLIKILNQNNANKLICNNLFSYIENSLYIILIR